MTQDEMVAALAPLIEDRDDIVRVRMFGGYMWKLNGNMFCGVGKDHFMFRVGKEQEAEALSRPGTQIVEFAGRRKGGIIWLDPKEGSRQNLESWLALAENFVGALPPK